MSLFEFLTVLVSIIIGLGIVAPAMSKWPALRGILVPVLVARLLFDIVNWSIIVRER